MGFVSGLRCVLCGVEVDPPRSAGTCPRCQDPFCTLEVEFDMDRVRASLTREALSKRPITHWRYHELLPIEPDASVFSWPVGGSPVLESPRLAQWAGVAAFRLKDDSRNPTLSFKDRASSVGVLHALQGGAQRIACASTGNAASSLAGYAAMAQLPATIFISRGAPEPKVAQMLLYGADVRHVDGTYDDAYMQCNEECDAHGWYNRNCAINPYLVEGKKTCGLEIAEQTASNPPDWVAVSVGDGCSVAGIAKGLVEMHELGFLPRLPRILAVQSEGVDPVARAFDTGTLPGKAGEADAAGTTVADSIDVPVPRNWRKAVKRVRELDGTFVRVSDDDIFEAMRACGRLAGILAEPAAAASVAGVRRAIQEKRLDDSAQVLAVITGNGLKDIRSAMQVVGMQLTQ
jgi:threonine synthase